MFLVAVSWKPLIQQICQLLVGFFVLPQAHQIDRHLASARCTAAGSSAMALR